MMTKLRAWILYPVTAAALLAAGLANADASAGTWQKHQYSFHAMSFTSTYSCDGLADKLKVLLLAAGARADAKAQSGGCARGFGRPDRLAQSDLTFYTLNPQADGKATDGQRAEGEWRPVTLAEHSPRELGVGDCEIVEQFYRQVLPMFATREVDSHITCIPYQDSGSVISLKFESFVAAKPKG